MIHISTSWYTSAVLVEDDPIEVYSIIATCLPSCNDTTSIVYKIRLNDNQYTQGVAIWLIQLQAQDHALSVFRIDMPRSSVDQHVQLNNLSSGVWTWAATMGYFKVWYNESWFSRHDNKWWKQYQMLNHHWELVKAKQNIWELRAVSVSSDTIVHNIIHGVDRTSDGESTPPRQTRRMTAPANPTTEYNTPPATPRRSLDNLLRNDLDTVVPTVRFARPTPELWVMKRSAPLIVSPREKIRKPTPDFGGDTPDPWSSPASPWWVYTPHKVHTSTANKPPKTGVRDDRFQLVSDTLHRFYRLHSTPAQKLGTGAFSSVSIVWMQQAALSWDGQQPGPACQLANQSRLVNETDIEVAYRVTTEGLLTRTSILRNLQISWVLSQIAEIQPFFPILYSSWCCDMQMHELWQKGLFSLGQLSEYAESDIIRALQHIKLDIWKRPYEDWSSLTPRAAIAAWVFADIAHCIDVMSLLDAPAILCPVNEIHGIAHMDIKPDNIVLFPDGHWRLIDYAGAAAFGSEYDMTFSDKHYVLFRGNKHTVDAGIDQWALMQTLYAWLNRQLPILVPRSATAAEFEQHVWYPGWVQHGLPDTILQTMKKWWKELL